MNNIENKAKNSQNKAFFSKSAESAISDFSSRGQEIIKLRYGIGADASKTLEEIGKKYEITRERVRQIVKEVFKKMNKKKESSVLEQAKEKIIFQIQKRSGIIREEELLVILSGGNKKEEGAIAFFLEFFDDFIFVEIPGETEKAWKLKNFSLEDWRKAKDAVKNILEEADRPVEDAELFIEFEKKNIGSDEKKMFDHLEVSSEVKKNVFQKWGLSKNQEISPKGTREKIYLVLKETGMPLHFKKIAELIDKYNLNKKKTHPQTVHNELIRDKRFVLVGRGIYALSEWGYKKGTVKDVLEEILKKSPKPMKKDDILEKIFNLRKVKKATVIINLNSFFQKVGKDMYTLKK
jgi:DNA-directed RNA polymerase delta subunit